MATLIHGDRIGAQGHIRASSLVAIFTEGKKAILLTRRTDNGRWCLPGGGIEAGENAEEAAIREVREEVGLDVHVQRLIGVYSSLHILLLIVSTTNHKSMRV
ncbi:MAG: NUDIX domain-containing protein [bacterium]|nr:NUDIX domain-containing protein [bacterium]